MSTLSYSPRPRRCSVARCSPPLCPGGVGSPRSGRPGEGVQQAARTRGQSSRRRVRLRLAGGAARRRGQRILRDKKFMLSNL